MDQPVVVRRLDGFDAELARPRGSPAPRSMMTQGRSLPNVLSRLRSLAIELDLDVDAIGLRRSKQTERVRLFLRILRRSLCAACMDARSVLPAAAPRARPGTRAFEDRFGFRPGRSRRDRGLQVDARLALDPDLVAGPAALSSSSCAFSAGAGVGSRCSRACRALRSRLGPGAGLRPAIGMHQLVRLVPWDWDGTESRGRRGRAHP